MAARPVSRSATRPGTSGGGGSGAVGRVQPVAQREDRFARGGRALLAAARGDGPLERLLAVARLALGLLADALRPGADPQEVPVLTLGHHYLSVRDVNGEGDIPSPNGLPSATLRLQEVCTFDPQEGPKRYAAPADEARTPLAALHWQIIPVAHAKAKRLGRELSVKIELGGACIVTLYPAAATAAAAGAPLPTPAPPPSSQAAAGPAATPHAASDNATTRGRNNRVAPQQQQQSATAAGEEEVYEIQFPGLLLLDPLAPDCPLTLKGDLLVSCAATGLAAALRIQKDTSVEGVLEGAMANVGTALAAGLGSGSGARGGGGRQLGAFYGSWKTRVFVVCPELAMQGVVFDCAEGIPAAAASILSSINLRRPGPLACYRLWAALHDSVLYTDPRAATGGRAATRLAGSLASYLSALTLAGPDASQQSGTAAGASIGAAAASDDPDIAAFDRAAEALGADGGNGAAAPDTRAVPPCYKEQHAMGRRLWYTLHFSLTTPTR